MIVEEPRTKNLEDYVPLFFSIVLSVGLFPLYFLVGGMKIIREYETAVIFRLGKISQSEPIGPGLLFTLPCIDEGWDSI